MGSPFFVCRKYFLLSKYIRWINLASSLKTGSARLKIGHGFVVQAFDGFLKVMEEDFEAIFKRERQTIF
tara:strand:- start:107056 stop:107262 length:207 start_codon:yes stop_codon:yes gene_type:complete